MKHKHLDWPSVCSYDLEMDTLAHLYTHTHTHTHICSKDRDIRTRCQHILTQHLCILHAGSDFTLSVFLLVCSEFRCDKHESTSAGFCHQHSGKYGQKGRKLGFTILVD